MKILYLVDQVYKHGGVEKVLSQKANYLADISGEEVFIVTNSQNGKNPAYEFSDKIQWRDLDINYHISKSYFILENLKKIPKHISALKKCFDEVKPDVIISSNFGPDFYFLPYLFKKIPKIKEFHSSRYFYVQSESTFKKIFFQKLDKFAEKKYHQIVVLNYTEKEFYQGKISVIANPSEKSDCRADFKSKNIIAAGRLSPVKNFGDLIKIFSKLSKEFPDWELHFFGEDYLGTQEKLEKEISDMGLESQIKFKGVTSDLKKEMKNYSIYAMTSETECFPLVLLEALSVGLPVISYDCPTGPKHILTNEEDSLLVHYKNLDIFTEKLRVLMNDENIRREMGKCGIENIKRFEISNVMVDWRTMFNNLILAEKNRSIN